MRSVRSWRVPSRSEVLPISDGQSCAICSDDAWQWIYLLLNAPQWVQERGWFGNWFIALCEPCHQLWDDDDAIRLRWELNDEHQDPEALPDFNEYRRVVAAMRSEPALPRALAVSR